MWQFASTLIGCLFDLIKHVFDWESRVEKKLRLADSFDRKDALLAKRLNEQACGIVRFHTMVHLPGRWGYIQNMALLFCGVGVFGSGIAGVACVAGVFYGDALTFGAKVFGLFLAFAGSLLACVLSLALWNLYTKKNVA